MDSSVTHPVALAPRLDEAPRLIETILGRLLELVVYAVEGFRDRLAIATRTR